MTDLDKLIETVARDLQAKANEHASSKFEMMSTAEAFDLARAALAAIEASGTHQIVLVQELHELGAELLGICDQQIELAEALGQPDKASSLRSARATLVAGLSARPRSAP